MAAGQEGWNAAGRQSILRTKRAHLSCPAWFSSFCDQGADMRLYCYALISIVLLPLARVPRAAADDLFPDKNLEAVVRQNVFEKKNKSDPLVEADVVNLSRVEGRGKSITSLQGLEKCKSLALLD